jgi:site-specific recombinase
MTKLIKAALAAFEALRSYQYGNAAPGLAEEVADVLQNAIREVMDDREAELRAMLDQADQQIDSLSHLLQQVPGIRMQERANELLLHCKNGKCSGSPAEIKTMISTLEYVLQSGEARLPPGTQPS